MTTEAFVTPEILTWARQRMGLDIPSAAKRLGVVAPTLQRWERGESRPTFKKAGGIADKLNVPFGYLFLAQPPSEELPLPDLRTLLPDTSEHPSPDFLEVLEDALRKQDWYREYLQDKGAESLPFVGKYTLNEPVSVVASDLTSALRIDDRMRADTGNWEQFLTEFVRRAEDAGVLVLRSGIVGNNTHRPLDVSEFRGFAISDPLAPLVFINSKDAKSAQIFTLAHELAHLWIGQSGISNPDYSKSASRQNNPAERQCDRIAAQVLVPPNNFSMRWDDTIGLDENIAKLSRQYRVSRFVILRSAYDYGRVEPSAYAEKLNEFKNDLQQAGTDGGGNYPNNVLSRNSRTFTMTVLTAVAEGKVHYREAASLLNISTLATYDRLEARLLGSGPAHA